mgnify:FL=1
MLIESAEISSMILTVVALASVFAWGSNTLGTFDHPAATLLGTGLSEIPMLLSIQLLLLIAGMFLDAISIYFIFLLLLIPIAMHFNWDLVWFGVNLMVTCRMAGVSMESTVPWVLWMVAAMAGTMFLVTFVPELALWLPRHLGYL